MSSFWKSLVLVPLLLMGSYLGLAYFGGFPPFYYVEFNKVKANLESIEGLEILDNWQHHDISLEDCSFTVRTGESEAVSFELHQPDDWSAPFEHLDGVVFTYPTFPGMSRHFGRVFLDAEALRKAGVGEVNLKGVLRNLEKVLAVVRMQKKSREAPELRGEWMVIRYDLDRYENSSERVEDGEPEAVQKIVDMARQDRDFLELIQLDWKRHSYSKRSPEMEIFDELGVEATIPNLVRGWVSPNLFDEALKFSVPLSRDGLVRVGSKVAYVKVNRNLVMVYREKQGRLTHEIWKNED
jgi:hypothetical protein